jgi:hypothetical protein
MPDDLPPSARPAVAPRLILGVFIVLTGVAMMLDQLGVGRVHYYVTRFWPTVVIAIGLARLLRGTRRGSTLSVVLIVGGAWLLLNTLGVVTLEPWQFIWPLVLVAVGARIMTGASGKSHWRRTADDSQSSSVPNSPRGPGPATAGVSEHASIFSLLSSSRRRWGGTIFRSAEATCILGGCELDLRDASLGAEGTAHIETFILMGGLKIYVPPNWTVVTHASPVMGGVNDKTRSVASAGTQQLIIDGTVMMGGIEISN